VSLCHNAANARIIAQKNITAKNIKGLVSLILPVSYCICYNEKAGNQIHNPKNCSYYCSGIRLTIIVANL
jgi:hypothetical protein